MVVGITGGIACGKSRVGKIFERMGAKIIEADEIGWEILEDEEIKREVLEVFGREFLGVEEKIDRKRLGDFLFDSKERLQRYNQITHPPLLKRLKERIERATGAKVVAVVATLIAEWRIEEWFDSLICITSPTEKQMERLLQKGMTQEEAEKRISAQLPQSQRVKSAEFVITNDGSLQELDEKSRRIFEVLRKRVIEEANPKSQVPNPK